MTIGQRNNNPLNIRRVKGQKWKGEAPFPPPLEGTGEAPGSFVHFSSLTYGLRAAFCILRTYRNKYHAVCIEDIITRWAPPTENDTHTYISAVCKLTGFGGKERLTENHSQVHLRCMQAHRLRRKRKAHRKQLAAARQGHGPHRKRHEPHGKTNPTSLPTLQTITLNS